MCCAFLKIIIIVFITCFTDRESSFTVYNVMKFSQNFMLKSFHKDWHICQVRKKNIDSSTPVILDFYNGDPDVLDRCTFIFQPITQNDDKLMNCRNVLGPVVHPTINGQPLSHPPHLVTDKLSPVPAQEACIPICPVGSVTGGMRPIKRSITNAESM